MKNYLKHFWAKPVNQRGDTIIEVMISMSILAVVLATAYATTNHSLQTGFNSQYRDQALSYAQQQVELIKNADSISSAALGTYQQNQFCINPSTTSVQGVDSNTNVCPWPVGSGSGNPSQYSLVDNYNSSNKTFSSTVQWSTSNGVTNQVVLYYKAHDSFVTTLNAFNAPTSPTTTTPPTVGLAFSANPSSVSYNGSSNLTWASSNASSCTASGGWSGSKPLVSPGSGQSVGPLGSTTTFVLSCTNGGSTTQKSVTVTVAPPPSPTLSFSASPTTVAYGSAATLTWASTNATSCTASGSWSGGKNLSDSQSTGGLTSFQSYTLTCSGISGTTPAQKNVTVAVNPPPPYAVLYQCGQSGVAGCTNPYTGYTATINQNGSTGLGSRYYGSLQYFNATFTLTIYDNRGVCEYFYHGSGSMGEHITGGVDKVYRNPMISGYGYNTGGNCSNQG